MNKNYDEECKTEACREMTPIESLFSSIENELNDLFYIKNRLEQKAHDIKNTRVPEKDSTQTTQDVKLDVIQRLERVSTTLSVIRAHFGEITNKFESLI